MPAQAPVPASTPPPGGTGSGWQDLTPTGEQSRILDGTGPVRRGTPDGIGPPPAPGRRYAVGRLREGARSELRRQLREVERWRRLTLVVVVLLVLGAYPSVLLLQAATRDPAINSLNALDLPSWAGGKPSDVEFGSRWCIRECRFRERTLTSERGPDETAKVYEQVLSAAGWNRWRVDRCPEQPVPGTYSCWRRDEYTLDLWVRDPNCAFDPLRNRPTVGPTGQPSDPPAAPADDCTGALVSIKVRNAIADDRGRGGAPPPPPENPDVPTYNPSLAPTPSGSPG